MDQRSSTVKSDCRSQITVEKRPRALQKLIDVLQRRTSPPMPREMSELENIAVRLEEKCFSTATSQVDYVRKIYHIMRQLERDSQGKAGARPLDIIGGNQNRACLSIGPKESSAAKVHDQTMPDSINLETENHGHLSGPNQSTMSSGSQNRNLHATCGALKNSVNITPGQGLMTNIHAHTTGLMQERLRQQSKQNHQSPNSLIYQHHVLQPTSPHPLHMQPVQQQQKFLLHGNQLRQLEQSKQPLIQQTSSFQIGKMEPSIMQSPSQCNHQQNQLNSITKSLPSVGRQKQQTMGPQSNISNIHQSQLLGQQMLLNQQYFGAQNNIFGHHHHSQHLGDRSRALNMQQNQQPVQLNQTKTGYKQEPRGSSLQTLKPQCLQSQIKSSCQSLMREIQPQPAEVATLPQASSPQIIMQHHQGSSTSVHLQTTEQLAKFIQSNREHSEVSSAMVVESRTNPTNVGITDEETLQKIKSMKEKYFSELNEFYQRIVCKIEQLSTTPTPYEPQLAHCETFEDYTPKVENLKCYKKMLEIYLKLLQISKGGFSPGLKEMIPMYEKRILEFLAIHRSYLSRSQGQQQFELLHEQGQFMTEQKEHSFGSPQRSCRVSLQNAIGNPLSVKTLQSNNSCRQPGPNVVQDQNLKLQQHEQNQHLMPDQHMKQQLQQRPMQHSMQQTQEQPIVQPSLAHQQRKQQPIPQLPRHQVSRLHQTSEGNELKTAQQGYATQSELHQQLKPVPGCLTPSPCNFQTPSPHIYQNSSLSPQSKERTHSQVVKSPAIVPPPLTPIVSSISGDSGKLSEVSSLQNAETVTHQQISPTPTQDQSFAVLTPGISASTLLAEFITPEANETQRPILRLIRMLKSVSPSTLGSSIGNIGSVVSMNDSLAASCPGFGAKSEVGEDLALMTRRCLQVKSFVSQDGSSGMKMKHDTTSMPLNAISPVGSVNYSVLNCLGTAELDSTTSSSVKRQKTEVSLSIQEQIMDINLGLIDMAVRIAEDGGEIAAAAVVGEGTVVNCLFTPSAFSEDLKSLLSSVPTYQIMPLRLLLPSNYPNSSPILLEKLLDELNEETEGLSGKAQLRFSRALRCLSQPMSLGDMVRAWDQCVREVITEFAKQFGGGRFSSTYGSWKNCGGG